VLLIGQTFSGHDPLYCRGACEEIIDVCRCDESVCVFLSYLWVILENSGHWGMKALILLLLLLLKY